MLLWPCSGAWWCHRRSRNPRKVKRAFNSLRLTLALSKAHGAQAYPVQLAKLAIIQTSYFKV